MSVAVEEQQEERDEYMLTTVDNPFDPFTQWREWLTWDEEAGYCTSGLLARIARTSPELSDADQSVAVQDAIDEIVRENVSASHMKISKAEAADKFGTADL